jgi:NADH-quinone oxidoreductase subunit K
MIPLQHYLVLSAVLFSLGAIGVFVRRNLLSIFLCIELMLNAVNLTFIAYSRQAGELEGQVIALIVIAVAAAEAAVGLAILIALHRRRQTVNVDDARLLRY